MNADFLKAVGRVGRIGLVGLVMLCGSAFGQRALGPVTVTTINGVTITSGSGTLTLGSTTLNAGPGGTLGTAAFTAATAYQGADSDLTIWAGITPSSNVQSLVGAADYAAMRTLLGLVIGTNVQAFDADLTTYAGITPSANVQTLLGAADYAGMRTQLGLVIGTNVQAFDADLSTYAGITPSANVQTLLGAASFAAFKASLSLENVDNTSDATKNAASVTLTNKTISGASNTLTVRLANDVTGTLPLANGGTGQTSASSAINALVPTQTGNSGKFLKTDGSAVSWDTPAGGGGGLSGSTGSTDNSILRADGTGGSTVQSSEGTATIADTGLISAYWLRCHSDGAVDVGTLSVGISPTLGLGNIGLGLGANATIGWSANNDEYYGTKNVGFAWVETGVIKLTNGSTGGGVLEFPQVSAGGTVSSNSARLYAKDVTGTAEIFVKDEAGNETQISPHATDSPGAAVDKGTSAALPVVIKHRNEYLGTEEWIHLSAMAHKLEELTGEKFVFSRELPPEERKDWAAVQAELAAKRVAEQAAFDARKVKADAEAAAFDAKVAAGKARVEDRPKFLEERPADLVVKAKPGFLER